MSEVLKTIIAILIKVRKIRKSHTRIIVDQYEIDNIGTTRPEQFVQNRVILTCAGEQSKTAIMSNGVSNIGDLQFLQLSWRLMYNHPSPNRKDGSREMGNCYWRLFRKSMYYKILVSSLGDHLSNHLFLENSFIN